MFAYVSNIIRPTFVYVIEGSSNSESPKGNRKSNDGPTL